MAKAWFRTRDGGSYGPASREGWAILILFVVGVTLTSVGLPWLAGGALWSWLISPFLVIAATVWLVRFVHAHSNRPD